MNFPAKKVQPDIIKGSIATLVLFLAYVSFPLVGMLPGFLTPLPAIFYILKSGRSCAWIVVITTFALALIAGPNTAVLYIIKCGVITLALSEFMARGWSATGSIVATIVLNLILILFLATAYSTSHGVNIQEYVLKGISSGISQTIQFYKENGITGDELEGLQQGMQQVGELIGRIYPALLIIFLALITALNLALAAKLSVKLPRKLSIGDLRQFNNPEKMIWVVIITGFIMISDVSLLATTALNVLILSLSLYFIQGLAVLLHFFHRFKAPPFVRWICYLLLGLQPYLLLGVAALGIFDIWGDFRTHKPKNL